MACSETLALVYNVRDGLLFAVIQSSEDVEVRYRCIDATDDNSLSVETVSLFDIQLYVGDTVIGMEDNNDMRSQLLPAVCLRALHLDFEG